MTSGKVQSGFSLTTSRIRSAMVVGGIRSPDYDQCRRSIAADYCENMFRKLQEGKFCRWFVTISGRENRLETPFWFSYNPLSLKVPARASNSLTCLVTSHSSVNGGCERSSPRTIPKRLTLRFFSKDSS